MFEKFADSESKNAMIDKIIIPNTYHSVANTCILKVSGSSWFSAGIQASLQQDFTTDLISTTEHFVCINIGLIERVNELFMSICQDI